MNIYEIRKKNLLALIGDRKQRVCAEKWDTSPSALSQIASVNGKKNLGDELARKIERAENLPNGWFDTLQSLQDGYLLSSRAAAPKHGTERLGGAPSIQANAELVGMLSARDSAIEQTETEVAIPLYKEVAMTVDGCTQIICEPDQARNISLEVLLEAGVSVGDAACAVVTGKSMERVIYDGALIAFDRSTTSIIDGEIYAFDHGGMLRVKYLYRLPGGGLRIRSENDTEYPDEIIPASELGGIRILGWVFWWSTVRRKASLGGIR